MKMILVEGRKKEKRMNENGLPTKKERKKKYWINEWKWSLYKEERKEERRMNENDTRTMKKIKESMNEKRKTWLLFRRKK